MSSLSPGNAKKTSPVTNVTHLTSSLTQVEDKLFRYTDVSGPDECWDWKMGTNGKYGIAINETGKKEYSHRLSYRLKFGPVPEGMSVCHRCDNPLCVNPNHLFLGTTLDNNRDKVAKGRNVVPLGSKNGASKLTEEQVVLIRKSTDRRDELAVEFGVSYSTISGIKTGRYWNHLSGENNATRC